MSEAASRIPAGFGINLVAYADADISYGIVARAIAESLLRREVPFSIVNVERSDSAGFGNGALASFYARHVDAVSHPLNLYILFPDFRNVLQSNPWLLAPGRMHVAMLWWETTAIPPAWIDHMSRLDAIIADSSFIANVAANNLSLTPVIEGLYPLSLPADIRPDRGRFGIAADATVFVTSLSPTSDPARKNPVAAVRAFRQAFAAEVESVRLIVRLHHADMNDIARGCAQDLARAASGDARISVLVEPMSHAEVLSLYASSDVFVSLHRAEGLGLGLMEAMALGKPVIATAWSGNRSFMDYDCGCPVRYRLMRAAGHWDFLQPEFLGPHALWADPVIEDAVAWMQRLHADPQSRQRLGASAKRSIDAYRSEALKCAWIDQLIALWQAHAFMPTVAGKYSSPSVSAPAADGLR